MQTLILTSLTVLCTLFAATCFAQPGSLDMTFNLGTGADSYVYATAIQSDGKVIIGGGFNTYNGTTRNRIARLNADGTLDTSFDPGTGTAGFVYALSIQNDGKIIIGGNFTSYNGSPRSHIARLNADGTLDTTFDPGTGADVFVHTTTIQSDGKIIIGGDFTDYNGNAINRIARLNTDGTLDTSFDPGTGASNIVNSSTIQNDGKIIIAGNFTHYNGIARNRIARLNTDGTLDTTFDPGSGSDALVRATAIQNDGKIIIAGSFSLYNNTARKRIARLNTDGSLDNTFDAGAGISASAYNLKAISIQSNGKLIAGGYFFDYNGTGKNNIVCLNTDGSQDLTFNPAETGADGYINALAIQNDGKLIIAGNFTDYNGTGVNRIARLNASGNCAITDVIVNSISACNPPSNTYTVELSVHYDNPPSTGTLIVYGTPFQITGSPQTITLEEIADGQAIPSGSFAYFEDDYPCQYTFGSLWTAPLPCGTTGISDVSKNTLLSVYPNPTRSMLNIDVTTDINIKIVNLLGETVIPQQVKKGNNSIDVSNLSTGAYFIQTENGSTVKFVKQ